MGSGLHDPCPAGLQAPAKGVGVRAFLDLHLQAEQPPQVFEGGARLGLNHMSRTVMTRDQAPQLPVHHDGHRQAGAHTHVAQVLQVHG